MKSQDGWEVEVVEGEVVGPPHGEVAEVVVVFVVVVVVVVVVGGPRPCAGFAFGAVSGGRPGRRLAAAALARGRECGVKIGKKGRGGERDRGERDGGRDGVEVGQDGAGSVGVDMEWRDP